MRQVLQPAQASSQRSPLLSRQIGGLAGADHLLNRRIIQ